MIPPGSSRAIAVPASADQLGSPSSARPSPSKHCCEFQLKPTTLRAVGLTRLVAGAGVPCCMAWPPSHLGSCQTLSLLLSPPSIFLWAEQASGEVIMLTRARRWHLTPPSSGRQADRPILQVRKMRFIDSSLPKSAQQLGVEAALEPVIPKPVLFPTIPTASYQSVICLHHKVKKEQKGRTRNRLAVWKHGSSQCQVQGENGLFTCPYFLSFRVGHLHPRFTGEETEAQGG